MASIDNSEVYARLESENFWEVYYSEGKPYYYHKKSGETTWDRPHDFKTKMELLLLICPWRVYTSDSGQPYYYNTKTKESVWDEPPEHKALREEREKENKKRSEAGLPPLEEEKISDEKSNESQDLAFNSYQERVNAFKKLLEQAGVTSTWTWDMTMKAIINDKRYRALDTLSEKKQVLLDFQAEKKKLEREEKRKKDMKLRETFLTMLKECEHLHPKMTWRKAIPYFEGDIRFGILPEREKEEIFEQYIYDLEKKIKDSERQKRKDNMKALQQKFEQDSSINVTTQWRKVKEQYKDDSSFLALDKMDQLTVFQDYIKQLESIEEEKKRSDVQTVRREARKVRDAFRDLLHEHYKNGTLTMRTRWKDFQKLIKDDDRYKQMVKPHQPGRSLPSELFCDFVDDLEENFYKDKKTLKSIYKELEHFQHPKNIDEFISQFSSHPKFSSINPKNYSDLYEDYLEKTGSEDKKKEKEKERKRRRYIDKFMYLLDSLFGEKFNFDSKWSQVREHLAHHSVFEKLDEETKEKYFQEFLVLKKQNPHFLSSSESEEGHIRSDHSSDHERKSKKSKKDKKSKKEKKSKHKRRRSDSGTSNEELDSRSKKKVRRDSSSEEEGAI